MSGTTVVHVISLAAKRMDVKFVCRADGRGGFPVPFVYPKPYWVRQLMRRFDVAAITMPWRRAYILPEHEWDTALICHELVHIQQIERDGPWYFTVHYLWWLARHGYWKNPYEVEAYRRAPL